MKEAQKPAKGSVLKMAEVIHKAPLVQRGQDVTGEVSWKPPAPSFREAMWTSEDEQEVCVNSFRGVRRGGTDRPRAGAVPKPPPTPGDEEGEVLVPPLLPTGRPDSDVLPLALPLSTPPETLQVTSCQLANFGVLTRIFYSAEKELACSLISGMSVSF